MDSEGVARIAETAWMYQRTGADTATAAEHHYAAGTPPFLQPVLGEAWQRRQLLSSAIHWDRLWFLRLDGELAGYLQAYIAGRGPHGLEAVDLRAAFGRTGASWRRPALDLVHRRFARFPAYLYRFIILPPFRGQGWGRRFLQAWLDEQAGQGIERIHLEGWGKNPGAIAFYRSLGFVPERRYRLPLALPGLPDTRWQRLSRPLSPGAP